MYIDGSWTQAKSKAVFDVFNPANNEKIGEVPDGGRDDAAGAIDCFETGRSHAAVCK